jgi:hypothetical protein
MLLIEIPPVVLSCQNQRSKHLNFQYIYLISYKIAKKGKPPKTDLPLKAISQVFEVSDIYMFIAEITRLVQVVIWYGYHRNSMS